LDGGIINDITRHLQETFDAGETDSGSIALIETEAFALWWWWCMYMGMLTMRKSDHIV